MPTLTLEQWRQWLAGAGRNKTEAEKLRKLARLAEAQPELDLEADLTAAYFHCGLAPRPHSRDWTRFSKLVQARLRPELRAAVERIHGIRAHERSDDFDSMSGPLSDRQLLRDLLQVPGFRATPFGQAWLGWSRGAADFCFSHTRLSQEQICRALVSGKTSLELRSMPIELFPESDAEYLESLEDIKLSGLPSTPLTKHIGRCVELRRLRFENMEVLSLPEELRALGKLETLIFWGCNGPRVPELVWRLPQLLQLQLDSCMFEQDCPPFAPGALQHLRLLKLSCKGLVELGDSLAQLRKLETLTIHAARFAKLPDAVGELGALRKLEIVGSLRLEELPTSLPRVASLRILSLMWWQSPALSPVLFEMKQLESLSLLSSWRFRDADVRALRQALSDTDVSIRYSADVKPAP